MNTLHNCSHFQQRSGLIRNPSRGYKRLLGSPPLTEPDSIPKSGLQWKQLNLVTNPGWRKKGSIIVEVKSKTDKCRDSKDNFLLDLAIDSKADYLITGDNDLLEIKLIGETKILTIKEIISEF